MLVPTIQRRRCLNYLRHIKQERILSVLSKKLSHAAGTFVRSKNHLRLTLAVVGFALLADLTRAESVVPGSDCHSITPGQATKMEWREQGLKNKAAQDYWVNCPFERPITKSELIVSIRAVNESSDALGLQCNFREIYGGRQRQSSVSSSTIPSGEFDTLQWAVSPRYQDSIINATCKLPDGITIEATRIGYSKNCSIESIEGSWIYTDDMVETNAFCALTVSGSDGVSAECLEDYSTGSTVTVPFELSLDGCTVSFEATNRVFVGVVSDDRQTIHGWVMDSRGYESNGLWTRVSPE